jgi:hypothetical protein
MANPIENIHDAPAVRQSLRELHKDRRWEISTAYGIRHPSCGKLEDAVAEYLAEYGLTTIPPGTYVEWIDGEPVGAAKPLKPALDSIRESKSRPKE